MKINDHFMKHIFKVVSLALLIVLFIGAAGCSEKDPNIESPESSVQHSSNDVDSSQQHEAIESSSPPVSYISPYPNAISRGDRYFYDYNTLSQSKERVSNSDFSIIVNDFKYKNDYYVTDIKTGNKVWVTSPSGKRFLFVSVTVGPITTNERYTSPYASDFKLVDGINSYSPKLNICPEMNVVIENLRTYDESIKDRYALSEGEIYVKQAFFGSLNKAKGSGAISGWLIFEVPDTLTVNQDTYVTLSLGPELSVWKLFDIMASVSVDKSPLSGDIGVTFNGGPEAQMIHTIEVEVIQSDGIRNIDSFSIESGQRSIPATTKITVPGSKPGEGKDHVIVTFIRRDGERIIKYDDYIEAKPRGPS